MEKKRSLKRKLCIAGIGVAALAFSLFLYDSISYEKIVNHRLLDTEGVTFTYNGWTYGGENGGYPICGASIGA